MWENSLQGRIFMEGHTHTCTHTCAHTQHTHNHSEKSQRCRYFCLLFLESNRDYIHSQSFSELNLESRSWNENYHMVFQNWLIHSTYTTHWLLMSWWRWKARTGLLYLTILSVFEAMEYLYFESLLFCTIFIIVFSIYSWSGVFMSIS